MANPRSEILNAKRKLSLIFDKNGSTLEKEDIDEDGGSVKTITKTPASLLEVGPAGNKDHLREMSNNSIANPLGAGVAARAASNSGMDNNVDLVHMDRDLINLYSKKETADSLEKLKSRLGVPAAEADPSFGEPPAEAFGDGPNDLSPHIGKDGRYLTNAEYYGTGQADLWQSPEGREIITHGWGGYDANIVGGYLGTNDEYPVIYSDNVACLTFGIGATPTATFGGGSVSMTHSSNHIYANQLSSSATTLCLLFPMASNGAHFTGTFISDNWDQPCSFTLAIADKYSNATAIWAYGIKHFGNHGLDLIRYTYNSTDYVAIRMNTGSPTNREWRFTGNTYSFNPSPVAYNASNVVSVLYSIAN